MPRLMVPQVFVVDIGRSYQGLAEQFEDSQFIDFGVDATFSLNLLPSW
jgi:conjugal transfer ATP-binding protein TraC